MDRYSVLNIFITASVLSCLCHSWEVQVPGSVTAVEGSCVMLPCRTSSHSGVVWYLYRRSSSPVVYSREYGDIIDGFRGRTSVPGNPAQGDCSLKINSVRPEDNDESLYPWIHPDTGNKYHYIEINVVNPEVPRFSLESQQVEGQLFSANCRVRHSCPSSPPPVEWLGLSNVSNNVNTVKNQDGLWTSVFQAQFRPNRQDHEKTLRCRSVFGSQAKYSEANYLNVLYAPSDVRIQAEGNSVVEGGSLSLTCSGTSRPPPSLYEWSVIQMNTTVKSNGTERRYTLQNIQRDTSVSCTVYNSVGQGQSQKLELNVHYAPSDVRIQAEGNSVVEGGSLSLTCSGTSRPPPSRYEWSVIQMNTTVKSSGTERRYTLQNIQRETLVSCTVYNSIGRGQSEKLELNVHFPPKILPSPNCSEWAGGLRCVCRAEAEPRANVSWTVDGSRARFPHFNTTTTYIGTVAVSELTGPLTRNVSCTASNYLSTDRHHMTVQIPEPEGISHVVIIAAGAAGVAVCVTLGIIVTVVWLKRRRQIPSKSPSSQPAGLSKKSGKTDSVCNDNMYFNETDNQDLYTNTMEMSRTSALKDGMDDIYANY